MSSQSCAEAACRACDEVTLKNILLKNLEVFRDTLSRVSDDVTYYTQDTLPNFTLWPDEYACLIKTIKTLIPQIMGQQTIDAIALFHQSKISISCNNHVAEPQCEYTALYDFGQYVENANSGEGFAVVVGLNLIQFYADVLEYCTPQKYRLDMEKKCIPVGGCDKPRPPTCSHPHHHHEGGYCADLYATSVQVEGVSEHDCADLKQKALVWGTIGVGGIATAAVLHGVFKLAKKWWHGKKNCGRPHKCKKHHKKHCKPCKPSDGHVCCHEDWECCDKPKPPKPHDSDCESDSDEEECDEGDDERIVCNQFGCTPPAQRAPSQFNPKEALASVTQPKSWKK